MSTFLSHILVPSYLFFSPGFQISLVLQKLGRSQILLHNSITLPLLGFSHIPISNIHYTKLPTDDFVRRQRKKEGIIYDLLKFPSTSRIKYVSTTPSFLFSKVRRKYALLSYKSALGNLSHPLWDQDKGHFSPILWIFFSSLYTYTFCKCANIYLILQ